MQKASGLIIWGSLALQSFTVLQLFISMYIKKFRRLFLPVISVRLLNYQINATYFVNSAQQESAHFLLNNYTLREANSIYDWQN